MLLIPLPSMKLTPAGVAATAEHPAQTTSVTWFAIKPSSWVMTRRRAAAHRT